MTGPKITILPHTPRIGEVTFAVGDPFAVGRSVEVVVPVRGIGQGRDGYLTLADGKRALAKELRALADRLDTEATQLTQEGETHDDLRT